MFANDSAASNASPASLSVIDPCNRTGKIAIPLEHVADTRGIQEYAMYQQLVANGVPVHPSQIPKDLSLCLLFQNGRCNAGARCNQVHADPIFVAALRERAMSSNGCCARHGDVNSESLLHFAPGTPGAAVVIVDDGEERTYPLGSFSRTGALDNALRRVSVGQSARVMASRVCRLHRQGRCKFGRDCKNVHLCRDAAPLQAHLNAAATKPFTVTASPAPLSPSRRRFQPGHSMSLADSAFVASCGGAASFRSGSLGSCSATGFFAAGEAKSATGSGSSTPRPEPASDAASVASSCWAPSTSAAFATPAKPRSPPPLSGFATPAKPLVAPLLSVRSATPPSATAATVTPGGSAVLAGEFQSMRGDPLEFTAGSTFLGASVKALDASSLTDFGDFLDALEKVKPSPMRSPMVAL